MVISLHIVGKVERPPAAETPTALGLTIGAEEIGVLASPAVGGLE